ncbi:MAG: sugar ABC transporter permease [Bauldia sp.]
MFVLYPITQSAFYSLYDWPGVGARTNFIGLRNYGEAFRDPIFWQSLANNLILVIASVGIQIPAGFALALLLATKLRGMRFFRAVYFFPVLMSTVAIGLLWNYVYNPTFGLLDGALGAIGLGRFEHGWLGDSATALPSVIAVISWQWIPFYMVLFFAGLTTIPEELYEAARIDKAGAWQRFRWVTPAADAGIDHHRGGFGADGRPQVFRPDLHHDQRWTEFLHGAACDRHVSAGVRPLPVRVRKHDRDAAVRYIAGDDGGRLMVELRSWPSLDSSQVKPAMLVAASCAGFAVGSSTCWRSSFSSSPVCRSSLWS